MTGVLPDLATVKAIQKLAWAASSGSLQLIHGTNEEIHKAHERSGSSPSSASTTTTTTTTTPSGGSGGRGPDQEDVFVAREALEVLTVCLALCPTALDALNKDRAWQAFIIDLLLLCKSR